VAARRSSPASRPRGAPSTGSPSSGRSAEVADRLAGLAELGIERLIVVPGSLDADPAEVDESNARFAAEVLPELRDG
jgi:hypothetical protein